MTEHEDLIAEANENLHKAADAAPASARQAILTGKVEDQRMSLIARLKHALEQVTAERDGLIQTITERVREAEARVERVRNARAEHPVCEMYEGDDVVSCGWKRVVLDIDKALEEVEDGE